GTDDAADGGEGATTGCARPAHFTPARWFELAHRSIVPGVRAPSRREVTSRAGRTNLNPVSGSEANDDRLSCCRAAAHRSSRPPAPARGRRVPFLPATRRRKIQRHRALGLQLL